MKKIFTLILAASILSVNPTSAHTNEGDGKIKQNQTVQPDSLSVNDEQSLNIIATDAEEIYYQQLPGKQSQTDMSVSANAKTKQKTEKKTAH